MKSPNACLPACRLKQQLCVNHEQLSGAVADLMCKELLFVGIYSNNASAWLKFKNACVCARVSRLCAQKDAPPGAASLAAGSPFEIPTLIAATGNCCLYVVSHSNWKGFSLQDILKKTPSLQRSQKWV